MTSTCGSYESSLESEVVRELVSVKAKQTNSSQAAKDIRDELKKYFCTEGRVEWQDTQATAF